MSETVKEIRFIFYLLTEMGIPVKLPIVVRCDNVGTVFMAENSSSGIQTRHIDTRYHFVLEHVADNFIKIVFVRSEENVADVLTKNIGKEIYESMSSHFRKGWFQLLIIGDRKGVRIYHQYSFSWI
jgi:hypothetical protein